MKISVILGHPYMDSFNSAIAETALSHLRQKGHEVLFHDLHGEGFDPVMQPGELVGDDGGDALVARHQKEIRQAEGILIVHPNWWGQPPAILKGWIDRVLRENVAYCFAEGDAGGGLPIGLLKATVGIVLNTSNTPALREETVFGDPLERIWRDCVFDFCGVKQFERRIFRVIADSTAAERAEWLDEVRAIMDAHFPQRSPNL